MPNNIEENTMNIKIRCEVDGFVEVTVEHHLTEDLAEEDVESYLDLLNGLNLMLKHHPEFIAMHGFMARSLAEFNDGEIQFEPSEELMEAINTGNVVRIDKKKIH